MDKKLKKFYDDSNKSLRSFFGTKLEKKPQVIFVRSRKEINKLLGKITPSWLVGWMNNGKIYLLDKENYEKESCNKYSDENYYSLLKHELIHSFLFKLSKGNTKPKWFNEGICIYLSGQDKYKKDHSLSSFLDSYDKSEEGIYQESGVVIEILINHFGKAKLIKLIKSLEKINSKQEFYDKFREIYSFSLTYEKLNSFL